MRIPSVVGASRAALVRLTHTGVSDDGDVLQAALQPGPGRRFVCISALGAGEAALTLAGFGAEQVLAYDLVDPESLHRLLSLKLSAAHLLGREDYLAVMGLRPASRLRRVALADQVLRGLPEPERSWWRPRRRWLVTGLFRADRQAAFFAAFLAALRPLVPAAEREQMLFGSEREARVEIFRRHVRRGWLEGALRRLGERVNLFFPEAEWRASEYPRALNREPLRYLEILVAAGLANNPLFAHLVRDPGAPLPADLLPPHLRPGAFDGLRSALPRVRAVPTSAAEELPLGALPEGLHGAYLSNVVDYLTDAERRRLLVALVDRLGPGAPVLVYSNESFGKVPDDVGLNLDEAASAAARSRDRAAIYERVEVYRAAGVPPEATDGRSERPPRLRVVG